MAVVIQSASAGTWANTGSVTITKPSGLAEGDLMLACIVASDDTGSTVTSPSTPSGWTAGSPSLNSVGASTLLKMRTYYKEADAGDVAASDFTFGTITSGDWINGCILRITGAVNSSPIYKWDSDADTTDDSTLSGSISVNTTVDNSLVLMFWAGRDSVGSPTTSGYTVSGTNPTWTERIDTSQNDDLTHLIAIATATITTARTITSATATTSADVSDAFLLFFTIPEATTASVSLDALTLTSALPAPTPKGKATITLDALNLTGTLQNPTPAEVENTWVNEDRNADASLTNQPKT